MKYLNIILVVIASMLLFSSCEKNVSFNGDVEVGFDCDGDTLRVDFSNNYVYIPITLKGSSNVWPLSVDVEVLPELDTKYPAVEDQDFIITSKQVFFGEPEKPSTGEDTPSSLSITKSLELYYPVRDKDEYRFTIKISSASSDKIKITKDQIVVVAAKDDIDRLVGKYTATGNLYSRVISGKDTSYVAKGEGRYNVNVTNVDGRLKVEGLFNKDGETAGKLTAFYIDLTNENRGLSLPVGFNNKYYIKDFMFFVGINVITSDNKVLEGPLTGFYDSTYGQIFFSKEVTDNMVAFFNYNSKGDFMDIYNTNSFLKNLTLKKVE